MSPTRPPLRLALIGDGESPHLLKWVRALSQNTDVVVDLYVASSRGFLPAFDGLLPLERRLALGTQPRFRGGNLGLLRCLPRLITWLREVQPDWLAPHYLSSHGTLAWLAVRWGGVDAAIAGSAWGSDILVTPERSRLMRALTQRVLAACTLTTSDSAHMARRMHALGAREVLCFPFGVERLPALPTDKQPWLCFANRGLEPIYQPLRVLQAFAAIARARPEARLVLAHDGSLRDLVLAQVAKDPVLRERVQWVGRLDATTQAGWYARAQWYLSLPLSDSVSVSVLEAMAHGCVPILSDLPANHELVQDGHTGLILRDGEWPTAERLQPLADRSAMIGRALHDWVGSHALFPASVQIYLQRLQAMRPPRRALSQP